MRKRYKLRKIVSKRAYTTEEIAQLLDVHVQTVRAWRKEGLQPIEKNSSPYLFLGNDVRAFLAKELSKQKRQLSENEFYCLRCNSAVTPNSTYVIDRGITIGKNKQSIFFAGRCPTCDLELRRFATKEQIDASNARNKLLAKQPKLQSNQQVKDTSKGQMSLFG